MNEQVEPLTLGQELKRRREGRGIDLQEISNATRVAVRFLRAIEEDDFKTLPGGLFTRSFIRTYARHVGMDEEEAIARYYGQAGQVKEETKRYGLTGDAAARAKTSFWVSLVVVLAVAAVIALGSWGVWHYWQRSKGQAAEPPSVVQTSPTPPQPVSPSPTTPADLSLSPTSTPTSEPASSPAPALQAQAQAPKPEVLTMKIEAEKNCWLSVLTDDQTKPTQMTLKAGESRTFTSKERIKFTIGNVSFVNVTINGQPAEIPSTGLVAKDVVITTETIQQFVKR
jgi:cytoskeletal protein RodZ